VRVAESPSLWKLPTPRPASDRNDNLEQIIGPTGLPHPTIMRHLLDIFFIHFGCQFPFLDQTGLESQVDAGAGSAFLFNAIAGIAARSVLCLTTRREPADCQILFTSIYCFAGATTPRVWQCIQRSGEGTTWVDVGSTVPRDYYRIRLDVTYQFRQWCVQIAFQRVVADDTVDSESDLWMYTGCAVRMAYDLGLHLVRHSCPFPLSLVDG